MIAKLKTYIKFNIFFGIGLQVLLLSCSFSKMQTENKDVALFYEIKGHGENVVFLHGLLGSHNYWDGVVPDLGGHYKLILLDLLGFGDSPKPNVNYEVTEHVEKIQQAIDTAVGLNQKITIVGG